MLVNDQDIQVLYETCSSNECTKACNKQVGFTVVTQAVKRVACLFVVVIVSQISCHQAFVVSTITMSRTIRHTPNGLSFVFFLLRFQTCSFFCFLFFQICRHCYPCLRENERDFIKAAYLEHIHRGNFRRVYPPAMVNMYIQIFVLEQ